MPYFVNPTRSTGVHALVLLRLLYGHCTEVHKSAVLFRKHSTLAMLDSEYWVGSYLENIWKVPQALAGRFGYGYS